MTRESLPLMKKAGEDGGALLVNTASIAAKRPQAFLAVYSATKAGVVALTEAFQSELNQSGIRCTAICPAFVDTPMTDWAKENVSPEEMIRPEDIAEVVRCLLRLSPHCIIPELMMVRPDDYQMAAGV
jgi:NAD(P)-dependent dehydrogenase (short-subunit alcohol dehydrogenase family)